jgi:hypothetical protein
MASLYDGGLLSQVICRLVKCCVGAPANLFDLHDDQSDVIMLGGLALPL